MILLVSLTARAVCEVKMFNIVAKRIVLNRYAARMCGFPMMAWRYEAEAKALETWLYQSELMVRSLK